MEPTTLQVMLQVIAVLDALGVPYLVGGSLASSLYGIPRSTNDIDLVVDLAPSHVAPLIAALEPDFLVDEESINEAIQLRRSFNLIHMTTLDKLDLFVTGDHVWRRQELSRRQPERVAADPAVPPVYFASPEDTVLSKLDWYRRGGAISDRQWGDVQAVLTIQAGRLDRAYLHEWANRLGILDLLERALAEAGQAPAPPHPA